MRTSLDTELNWTGASEETQARDDLHLRLVTDEAGTCAAPADGSGTEEEVRRFLADIFFLGDDPGSIPATQSLIEAGIIDSTGVLELIVFLEEQYRIRIEDDELVPENLDTIESIVQFVRRKRAS